MNQHQHQQSVNRTMSNAILAYCVWSGNQIRRIERKRALFVWENRHNWILCETDSDTGECNEMTRHDTIDKSSQVITARIHSPHVGFHFCFFFFFILYILNITLVCVNAVVECSSSATGFTCPRYEHGFFSYIFLLSIFGIKADSWNYHENSIRRM